MLVKQDSCSLNNTESFLYILFFVMLTLLNVLFILRKGFCPKSMLIYVFIIFFTLNNHRVHVQVSVNDLLHSCFEKTLFK